MSSNKLTTSDTLTGFGRSFKTQDGDLYLDGNSPQMITDLENLAEGVARILKTRVGGNFLHPTLGFDLDQYLESGQYVGNEESTELMVVLLEQAILQNDERITKIDNITISRDSSNPRILNIEAVCITANEQTLTAGVDMEV